MTDRSDRAAMALTSPDNLTPTVVIPQAATQMPRRTACVAVALLTVSALVGAGCSPARQQPTPGAVASAHAVDVDPTATTWRGAAPTNVDQRPSPSPSAPIPIFEFVRWTTTEATLYSEPGGDVALEGTGDEPIAAVLDRTIHDGIDWIRVQVGRGYAQDYTVNGWVPKVADVEVDGEMVHVDPVYEPTTISCPDEPTVSDLDAMLPAQALACYESRTLTFSPVWVRAEGSEDTHLVTGEPEWLAIRNDLVMYDSSGWRLMGSITIHIDPASGIEVTPERWVEIEGQFDHPASSSCTRSADEAAFHLANQYEVELWCRERFVVTAARLVPEEEQPTPAPHRTPGSPATDSISFAAERLDAPFKGRRQASGVWTGAELIIWGGWEFDGIPDGPDPQDGGYAYDPASDRWRAISAGPLASRSLATATWTGSEMLVLGGIPRRGGPEGAAYDPERDRWRPMAPSPLPRARTPFSVWIGTEWVVTESTRDDRVLVAAYDPEADTWRSLPTLSGRRFGDWTWMTWTGTEIFLRDSTAGMFRLRPDASAWSRIPEADVEPGIHGPLVWTGDLIIGQTYATVPREVGRSDYWSYLTAWDPVAAEKVGLPLPPDDVESMFWWIDEHVVPLGSGYAFHPGSGRWLALETPAGVDRDEAVVVWTGDRLIIWGGTEGSHSAAIDDGLILTPQW